MDLYVQNEQFSEHNLHIILQQLLCVYFLIIPALLTENAQLSFVPLDCQKTSTEEQARWVKVQPITLEHIKY